MEEPSPRQKDGGAGLQSRGIERWALYATQACTRQAGHMRWARPQGETLTDAEQGPRRCTGLA
ncbi:unnamed protein product [Prunus armeniaca]|uniref:Uncharacterized protein n=1 Tax=Prunus armeniaca TaxID=36596 RepID=A0A6J5TH00_PRUAR|nr:unnamed protein product [Prunus armeniaca]